MLLLGAIGRSRSIATRRVVRAICLLMGAAAAPASAQIVQGTVVEDSSRTPITAVEVRLIGRGKTVGATAVADDQGRFVLRAPRAGRYAIEARRIGYQVKTVPAVDIAPRMELGIEISLIPIPAVLPATVTAESRETPPFWLDGFEHRRRLGLGVFFTRADLVQRGEPRLSELLRSVAGIDLSSGRSRPSPMMTRSSSGRRCFVSLFLDGFLMSRADDPPEVVRIAFESIPANTVQAVEVYKGRSELPAEFGAPDVRCGAVVVWTRRGQAPTKSATKSAPAP